MYWEKTIGAFVSSLKNSVYCLSKNTGEFPLKRKTRSVYFNEWNKMSLQLIWWSPAVNDLGRHPNTFNFFRLPEAKRRIFWCTSSLCSALYTLQLKESISFSRKPPTVFFLVNHLKDLFSPVLISWTYVLLGNAADYHLKQFTVFLICPRYHASFSLGHIYLLISLGNSNFLENYMALA